MPEPVLDEIQWRLPPQRILETFQGLGIQSNTVLWYFAESPFFDRMSNNQAIFTQSQFNPTMAANITTREGFEAQLRTMQGLEFMTAGEPQAMGETGQSSGIWIIRKQNRRKRSGMEDEVTVLGTYFVIGENIYQAPAVKDILSSKVLSISSSLTQFFTLAKSLPTFSPGRGYTYVTKPSATKAVGSTQASREGTTEPGLSQEAAAAASQATDTKADKTTDPQSSWQAQRELQESLSIAMRYGTEYMDENPLQGEPGSFLFSSTSERVRAQNAAAAATQPTASFGSTQASASQKTIVMTEGVSKDGEGRATGSSGNTPTPTPTERKGSGIGAPTGKEKKRRKSKAPVSPT